MRLFRARRAAARAAADREATAEAWEMRRIALQPDRPVGDPLSWPLPGAAQEPPVLFDSLCCPALSPMGVRCEKYRGHRVKVHGHALDVDDVLDVRVAAWRDPAKTRVTA